MIVTNPNIYELRNKGIASELSEVKKSGDSEKEEDLFGSIFQSALNNVNRTNGYLSQAENEEIKLAMGESESTHDLAVALQKASISLQYTVAVKNAAMEAYRQIMQMQI